MQTQKSGRNFLVMTALLSLLRDIKINGQNSTRDSKLCNQIFNRHRNVYSEKPKSDDVQFILDLIAKVGKEIPSADMNNVNIAGQISLTLYEIVIIRKKKKWKTSIIRNQQWSSYDLSPHDRDWSRQTFQEVRHEREFSARPLYCSSWTYSGHSRWSPPWSVPSTMMTSSGSLPSPLKKEHQTTLMWRSSQSFRRTSRWTFRYFFIAWW